MSAAEQENDLQRLRVRIEALTAKLAAGEEGRREAREALRAAETAISAANRRLRAIESQERALERELSARERALGRILAARAAVDTAGRAPDALRLALSGEEPAELERRLYYLSLLSRAVAQAAQAHRAALAELERIRARGRADREEILAERRTRQRLLAGIAAEIRAGRREMRSLKSDERRLGRLVEEIGRVIAEHPAQAAPGPFSSLRGRLRAPVSGELGTRSAAQRQRGAGSKGIFIRSTEGAAVKAVAAGRVVYADWMRGLGNLLIIDHGEDYLSVYGNNESLLKLAGDPVAAGDAIATVGASGGSEETGLYFELRHLGKTIDPLRWVILR